MPRPLSPTFATNRPEPETRIGVLSRPRGRLEHPRRNSGGLYTTTFDSTVPIRRPSLLCQIFDSCTLFFPVKFN